MRSALMTLRGSLVLALFAAAGCAAQTPSDVGDADGGDASACTAYLRACTDCQLGCGPCAQVCVDGVWGPCEPGPGACDGGPTDASANDAPDFGMPVGCGHHCEPCCAGSTCVDGSSCNGASCWLGIPCDAGTDR